MIGSLLISRSVALDLGKPKLGVLLDDRRMCLTPMPETAI
jgi:hypothetical protein